jgi:predicted dehydrogenase
MFIHWVDGARSIVGDVESVLARVAKVNPVIAGEDHALMVMGHTNGVTTLIDASWASPSERPRAGAAGDLLLEGRDGSLHFDALTGELRHITFDDTRVIESFAQQPSGPSAAFGGCIADFAAAIRHDRPMMSDGRDNLKTLAATLAAYESVERGTAVRPAL